MSAHRDAHGSHAAHEEPPGEEPPPGLVAARTGLVLTVVGVGALVLGAFGATNSEVQPSCPAGTVQLAVFQFDEQGPMLFEPANAPSPVLLDDTTSDSSQWSATTEVVALVIKAGEGSKDVSYEPGVRSGSFDTEGLDAALSSVRFCTADVPPPTKPTTTPPPPTKPTTTPPPPTKPTTTEVEPTTTEVEPTTTEVEPTTTTDGPPESSTPTTGASVPPSSTSTVSVPSTPSTEPGSPGSTAPESPAPQVSAAVVVATSITPDDDTRTGSSGALAFTGANSLPLLLFGGILVVVGVTMVMVARERTRNSRVGV